MKNKFKDFLQNELSSLFYNRMMVKSRFLKRFAFCLILISGLNLSNIFCVDGFQSEDCCDNKKTEALESFKKTGYLEVKEGDIKTLLEYIKFFAEDTSSEKTIYQSDNLVEKKKRKILVIFDLDGVIMIPVQSIGSDPWAYYEGDKHIAKYNNGIAKGAPKEAVIKGLQDFKPVWELVQNATKVRLVQSELLDVLNKIFASEIEVIGFTARGTNLADRTKYQLNSVDVDLSKNSCFKENFEQEDYVYKDGVLFVNIGASKGEILNKFFKDTGASPEGVIFVDDQDKNIKTIGQTCREKKIRFIGVGYSGSDEIVKLNDEKKRICDMQLEGLYETGEIMSDEQAKKLLV